MAIERLRVEQVNPAIHRQDAGPSYSVPSLCAALSALGHDVHLHTVGPQAAVPPKVGTSYYRTTRVLPALGISEPMRRSLKAAAEETDIVHFNGLWTMASVYPGWAVRGTNTALVASPRGTLEKWARNWHRYRKNAFWLSLQKRVLNRVDLFHATADIEADSIRAAGFTTPIAVVPIGIDIPRRSHHPSTEGPRRALYLSRLHPQKNVEALIEAWTSLSSRHPEWTLTIAGPGDPLYEAELHRLAAASNRVEMPGPAYGAAKAQLLSTADLFVLPSYSENFGIVVAEALSYGVPVVATVGTPWQGLVAERCGWWTQPTAEALSAALDEAMSLNHAVLDAMGRRGREWMEREFSWEAVARAMVEAYQWTRAGGAPPSVVRTT